MRGRCSSDSLPQLRLLPGQPAFAHSCPNECAPSEEITGEPPGAHPADRERRDQVSGKTALPEGLGPLLRPLGMLGVPVQKQYAQRIEMPQEALPVGAGLVPVAQDVAWHPDRRLRSPRWGWRHLPLFLLWCSGLRLLLHLWQVGRVQDAFGEVRGTYQRQRMHFPRALQMRQALLVALAATFELLWAAPLLLPI